MTETYSCLNEEYKYFISIYLFLYITTEIKEVFFIELLYTCIKVSIRNFVENFLLCTYSCEFNQRKIFFHSFKIILRLPSQLGL